MAIKNYDYKKFEISFKHLKISYFHLNGGYLRSRKNSYNLKSTCNCIATIYL